MDVNKNTGDALTSPKGDTTQKRRQAHRRDKLNAKAQAAGFASWSAYETSVLRDEIIINKMGEE